MQALYYSRSTGQFLRTPGPDTIATPTSVVANLLDVQRSGGDFARQPDGTPNDVAALLTVAGMQSAVFKEIRALRGTILNALAGLHSDGLDMYLFGVLPDSVPTQPADVVKAMGAQLVHDVRNARQFLKDITKDPDVLAVTPATGGWQAMGDLILYKWTQYAKNASPLVRGAFAEIA